MLEARILKILLGFLLVLAVFNGFYKLGHSRIQRWDEATNARVLAETMALPQPWFLQHEGEGFFEKPPLWYYLSMASSQLFGLSRFSLRLVSALSGLGILAVLVYLVYRESGFKPVLFAGFGWLGIRHLYFPVWASTHQLRSADTDFLQLFLIMLGFLVCYTWLRVRAWETKTGYAYACILGLLTGLAWLAKGPLAILTFLSIGSFCLLYYQKIGLGKAAIFQAFLVLFVFLLAILPWHYLMHSRYGTLFWTAYWDYHLVARYLQTLEGHIHPVWYYLGILTRVRYYFWGGGLFLILLMHFGLLQLTVLWDCLCMKRCHSHGNLKTVPFFGQYKETAIQKKAPSMPASLYYRFCLFFFPAAILLIISSAETKLPWYVIPVYPFAMGLLAYYFAKLTNQWQKLVLAAVIGLALYNSYQIARLPWEPTFSCYQVRDCPEHLEEVVGGVR